MFGFLNFFKSSKRDKSKALAENNALPLSDFEQLPGDVIGHVLSYLLPKDLRAVRGANKNCRALIDGNPKILSDYIERLLECYQAEVHEQITKDFPGASDALKESACYLVGGKEDSPFKIFMSTWVCQEREMLDLLERTSFTKPLSDDEKDQLKMLLEGAGKNEYTLENFVARNDLLNTINDRLTSGKYGFVPSGVNVTGVRLTRSGPDFLFRLEEKDDQNQPFFLYFRENNLRALPPLLSTLSNVTELDVGDNELWVVPEFVSQMPSLTLFAAYGNNKIGVLSKETEVFLENLRLGKEMVAFFKSQKNCLPYPAGLGFLAFVGAESFIKINKTLNELFDKKMMQVSQGVDDVSLESLLDAKDYLLGREVFSPTIARWKIAAFPKMYSPAFTMGLKHRLSGEPSKISEADQRKLEVGGELSPRSIRFC